MVKEMEPIIINDRGGCNADVVLLDHQPVLKNYDKIQQRWTKELVTDEALKFYRQRGKLTDSVLLASGRTDLSQAIRRHFGGMGNFKVSQGLKLDRRGGMKPLGYWTRERVVEEARSFFDANGNITVKLLYLHSRGDLHAQIKKYFSTNMSEARLIMGLQNEGEHTVVKRRKVWTEELIESTALSFFHKHKRLDSKTLRDNGMTQLLRAIYERYPEGLIALK